MRPASLLGSVSELIDKMGRGSYRTSAIKGCTLVGNSQIQQSARPGHSSHLLQAANWVRKVLDDMVGNNEVDALVLENPQVASVPNNAHGDQVDLFWVLRLELGHRGTVHISCLGRSRQVERIVQSANLYAIPAQPTGHRAALPSVPAHPALALSASGDAPGDRGFAFSAQDVTVMVTAV
jgi:hypothetical protein